MNWMKSERKMNESSGARRNSSKIQTNEIDVWFYCGDTATQLMWYGAQKNVTINRKAQKKTNSIFYWKAAHGTCIAHNSWKCYVCFYFPSSCICCRCFLLAFSSWISTDIQFRSRRSATTLHITIRSVVFLCMLFFSVSGRPHIFVLAVHAPCTGVDTWEVCVCVCVCLLCDQNHCTQYKKLLNHFVCIV